MALPGLPPLPKSLSGHDVPQRLQNSPNINYNNIRQPENQQLSSTLNSFDSQKSFTSSSSSCISRKNSTLDTQLAVLRREMVSLYNLLFCCFTTKMYLKWNDFKGKYFWNETLKIFKIT